MLIYKAFMIFLLIYFIYTLYRIPRNGIIIGLTFTTFCISAYPWSLVFPMSGIATIFKVIFIVLPFIYYFIYKRNHRLNIFSLDMYIIILFIIFSIMLAMLVFSSSQTYGIYKTFFFLFKSIFPVIAFSLLFPMKIEDINLIINTIIFGSILMVFNLFIISDITISRVTYDDELSPITIARTLGLGFILSFTVTLINNKLNVLKSMYYFGISMGIFIAMLFTGSRGPLLFSVIAIILILIFNRSLFIINKGKLFLMVTIPIIFYLFSNYIFNNLVQYKAIDRLTSYLSFGSNNSDMGRVERFTLAIREIENSYLLGIGTGGFDSIWNDSENIYNYPHNLFLEVLLELGILGLIFILCLLFIPLIRKIKYKSLNYNNDLIFGIFLYAFLNSMVSGDLQSNYLLWTSGGLIALIFRNNIINKTSNEKKLSYNIQCR